MLENIRTVALSVGINLVVTNAKDKLETQLNNITQTNTLPIMLISWDIDTTIEFDENSFLKNPESVITALLVTKAPTLEKEVMETTATEMGSLFTLFIQKLNESIDGRLKTPENPISKCTYKLLPMYGLGKHSGILAKWSMKTPIEFTCPS